MDSLVGKCALDGWMDGQMKEKMDILCFVIMELMM